MRGSTGSLRSTFAASRALAVGLAILFAIPLSALAAGEGFYLGVRAGSASTNRDSASLAQSLAARGQTATTSVDDNDANYSIYAGYYFTPAVALETAYGHLGEFDAGAAMTAGNPATFRADFLQSRPVSGDAWSLAVRWNVPVAGRWLYATPRLGGFTWWSSTSINGVEESDDGAGGFMALGLGVAVVAHLQFELGTALYYADSEQVIRHVYGGVEYRF